MNNPVSGSTAADGGLPSGIPGDAEVVAAGGPVEGPVDGPVDGRSARWTEHRATRREDLITAAVLAVREYGIDVGMDQIAQVARTSKPVIYRYFADKNELHRAMGDRIIGTVVAALDRVRDESDPRALMRASIDAYLGLLGEHPELFRFVTVNRVLNEAGPAEFSAPVAAVLTRSLGAWLSSIGLDPAAAEPWGEAMVGFIRAASTWWIDHPEAMTRAELTDYLTALLWGGGAGVFQAAGRAADPRPTDGVFARRRR